MVEEHAPERIKLPCGRNIAIRYNQEATPVLSATIQDLYGLQESPQIAAGTLALRIEILGPHRRPVQITDDLHSFWQNTYPELRPELSRRYPKHEWR